MTAVTAVTAVTDTNIRAGIDALLVQMTVEEKAGQLTRHFAFPRAPEEVARIGSKMLAGRAGSLPFVPRGEDAHRQQRIAVQDPRSSGGLACGAFNGMRTKMQVPLAMAASWDPALAVAAQVVTAPEARAIGLHRTFSPPWATPPAGTA